jgi:hypothetical protein
MASDRLIDSYVSRLKPVLDVERLHLGIADFDTLFVGSGIEGALDFQASFFLGRSDLLDHGHTIDERSPASSLRDVAE